MELLFFYHKSCHKKEGILCRKSEEERVRMSVREKTDIIMYRKQEGKKEKREKDPL